MKKESTDIAQHAHQLHGDVTDFDPLLDAIGDASFVLLGEATHGTHEFYNARAEITKLLITKKQFTTVAIEGDWPDAYTVNRYVRGTLKNASSVTCLDDFKRFPAWMWRNQDVVAFVSWLHDYNKNLNNNAIPVGFYGLDLYSLHRSMHAVIEQLERIDSAMAERARKRYECFDAFGIEPQTYGYYATKHPEQACTQAVIDQLLELKKKDIEFFKQNMADSLETKLYIEQNARVVKNAEHYYRSMFEGSAAHSWNMRDTHMMATLTELYDFAKQYTKKPKIVVWAHNSHIGDARATQMSTFGELNVGQLVKEQYASDSFLIGFTTYAGTVSAASSWDGAVERKIVRPAVPTSYETLFHEVGIPNFLLIMKNNEIVKKMLSEKRLERAIGVLYIPENERRSHYFYAHMAQQFDAIIHYDVTSAVVPLETTAAWEQGELPETFPSGM